MVVEGRNLGKNLATHALINRFRDWLKVVEGRNLVEDLATHAHIIRFRDW